MDLNHIELPPFVIAELYQKTLIEQGSDTAKPAPEPISNRTNNTKDPWKYTGSNKKQILILVETGSRELAGNEKEFLSSMLGACQLSEEDVVIVNRKDHPNEDYKAMTGHFNSRTVFLFGIDPAGFGLPVNFPPFQVQKLSNLTFLYSPPLDELQRDKLLKSKLWLGLKRIFTL